MHCGPIRYRDDPIKQGEKRPFDHYIVPRFTSLRIPLGNNEKDISIQEIYAEIADNVIRNQRIIDDVLNNYHFGRNCLVLSLRKGIVDLLAEQLKEEVPDVLTLIMSVCPNTSARQSRFFTNSPI